MPDYVNSFSMRHDITGELLCDAIHMTFVELSKVSNVLEKPVSEMTALDKWSVFFQYAPDPQYRETVNKVIESEEVLQVAGNLLMSISQDERERAVFRSRRKFQTDLQSDLATAEDNGERRGIAIGEKNRSAEIARSMMADGEPVDKIIRYTGLSAKEIATLGFAD